MWRDNVTCDTGCDSECVTPCDNKHLYQLLHTDQGRGRRGEETINGLEGGARIRVILVLVQEIHDDYGWWPHIITKNYFDKDLVSLV